MDKWGTAALTINSGGVCIIPTDTLYGIVAKASDKKAVKRIHFIKDRSANKPFIILISNKNHLMDFDIADEFIAKTDTYWPGPNSLIMPVKSPKFDYLTCGLSSLAFRLPANNNLINLINQTGPLVAPSANPEGLTPALTVAEAKSYFKNQIDFYLDGGKLQNPPSKLIDLVTDKKLR